MATRKSKRTSEAAREAIRTGMLVKRLQDHIDGKADLSQSQVVAAKTLLDRTMPSLSAVEYTQQEQIPAEAELMARILTLISSNPALKQALAERLNADLAQEQGNTGLKQVVGS